MIIEVESVTKTFTLGGSVIHALNQVSFQIEEGEKLAITGPSGSGKSTLLNILGCLDRPDSGQYILAGEDVSRLSRNQLAEIRNRRVGFVFQTFNLLSRMSALENVELPLLYAGNHEASDRAAEALRTIGLADRMLHEPNQLSGGERQRVAIARAIVTNPVIILADEPTGNLDTKTGNEIMALFEELNQQGRTIIIVTHDSEVSGQCHRQIRLRDGKVQDGSVYSGESISPTESRTTTD